MKFFRTIGEDGFPESSRLGDFASWSIRKKLIGALVPALGCILIVTGYATDRYFSAYISQALERNAIQLTLAQARELELTLERGREELLVLASRSPNRARLLEFMETRSAVLGEQFVELVFAGVDPAEQRYLINAGGRIVEIPMASAMHIKGNPLLLPGKVGALKPGQVALSDLTEISLPPTIRLNGMSGLTMTVFRLTTPVFSEHDDLLGYLILSLDGRVLRNRLSLFNSTKSPLYGFPRTAENRLSFFFDEKGWVLFQSENVEEGTRELGLETARAGLSGDHGKAGFESAFRPAPPHDFYWRIVSRVQKGSHGMVKDAPGFGPPKITAGEDFLGYAPVRFSGEAGQPPMVVGGVVYIDRSLLPRAAEFGQLNLMFIITIAATLALSLLLFFLSRIITRPIRQLTEAVRLMRQDQHLKEIDLPGSDMESTVLKEALNDLIASLASKEMEIRSRDVRLESVRSRERACLDEGLANPLRRADGGAIAPIIGASPAVQNLVMLIEKAAAIQADVLVVGETGTGKELTAEAIHDRSARAAEAYISINCGALDESLLMDALFGHVQGAFSEARSDRKGAFLAADGGTLHLDEIANASPKVQQALLRALSVRKIRPLGSDIEVAFDVRVIAATNVNLAGKVQAGEFRDDLYYRLQVLTIATPPLRERKEDIPLLADHFIRMALQQSGRGQVGLSRGALEKLQSHDWPGNIRELKNCLTRAAAMAERDLIYAEEIRFGEEPALTAMTAINPCGEESAAMTGKATWKTEDASPIRLNARQRRALRNLRDKKVLSRQDYQEAIGETIPMRTAQHDLQELVSHGILKKTGRGPATRYRMLDHNLAI